NTRENSHQSNPNQTAEQCSSQADCRCLNKVNKCYSARRSTQTAQNRASSHFLLQMRLDGARYPHGAQQQRNECDQIQKSVKILERCSEILFSFVDRSKL